MATQASSAQVPPTEEKLLTKREIQRAFMNLQPLEKARRDKAELTREQVLLIKQARKERHTPKQLEELTGLSSTRIAEVVALKVKPQRK